MYTEIITKLESALGAKVEMMEDENLVFVTAVTKENDSVCLHVGKTFVDGAAPDTVVDVIGVWLHDLFNPQTTYSTREAFELAKYIQHRRERAEDEAAMSDALEEMADEGRMEAELEQGN
jgi:hypothetical protein